MDAAVRSGLETFGTDGHELSGLLNALEGNGGKTWVFL